MVVTAVMNPTTVNHAMHLMPEMDATGEVALPLQVPLAPLTTTESDTIELLSGELSRRPNP